MGVSLFIYLAYTFALKLSLKTTVHTKFNSVTAYNQQIPAYRSPINPKKNLSSFNKLQENKK
jgi:hypothetical protein